MPDDMSVKFEENLYPEFFEGLLRGKPRLRSALDSSMDAVQSVLAVSHLAFFGDYTDHGLPHLRKVCSIADRLLGNSARAIFTAEDAAVLMLSVLLHDLGMHLSESGFAVLIDSTTSAVPHPLDVKPWPDVWNEFLEVARHWDDTKLVRVFGANDSGAPLALVEDPVQHYNNLTDADRKLIGEFIRQNHARMAHEFATVGFPGAKGTRIQLGSFDPEMRDLAGMIGRSHGLALRDSLPYLEQRFNRLEYN